MKSSRSIACVLYGAFIFLGGQSATLYSAFGATPPSADTPHPSAMTEIFRGGDFVIQQLVVPGFEKLPLERKLFVYYLQQAVDAGRDIAWTQISRSGLKLRNYLEALWENSSQFDPEKKRKLAEYFFKVLARHGNYDENGNYKVLPEGLSFEDFEILTRRAQSQLQSKGHLARNLSSELQSLRAAIFDPDYYPQYKPNGGKDLVADTAANFYGPGLSASDVQTLPPAQRDHPLSYPVRTQNGVELKLHRIGGRFSAELQRVHVALEQAKRYATPAEQKILSAFQKTIRTGDPQDQLAAERLWAAHQPTDVDFMIGFVETYNDPLDVRGTWEGFILLVSQPESGDVSRIVRQNSNYFESQMPVEARFKKPQGFTPPWASGANMIYLGGDIGESPFAGVNLPNDNRIREQAGSKSFTAGNVINRAEGKSQEEKSQERIFYSPRYQEALKSFDSAFAYELRVIFHEILGHGSGLLLNGVNSESLGQHGSPIEEARAEVAYLYHLFDPQLQEFGILNPAWTDEQLENFQELSLVMFFQNHLSRYYRFSETMTEITQAHQLAWQMMMNWMIQERIIEIAESFETGVPHVQVIDLKRARASMGRLWTQLQTARSTGNIELAQGLIENYGKYSERNKRWRNAIATTRQSLHLPGQSVFMNPRLELVPGQSGPEDVKLVYHSVSGIEGFLDEQVALSHRIRAAHKPASHSLCRAVVTAEE